MSLALTCPHLDLPRGSPLFSSCYCLNIALLLSCTRDREQGPVPGLHT